MPQRLPPGSRARPQPQLRRLDAMCSAQDEPSREGAADGRLADGPPVGVVDEHPGDGQPEDGDGVRQVDGHPGDGKGGLPLAANLVEPAR